MIESSTFNNSEKVGPVTLIRLASRQDLPPGAVTVLRGEIEIVGNWDCTIYQIEGALNGPVWVAGDDARALKMLRECSEPDMLAIDLEVEPLDSQLKSKTYKVERMWSPLIAKIEYQVI